ncbi:PQQ-binding-like beta-propeller repeat protein, partial [Noviherbaspirillum denitrificans]|uniref:outer membrane protein assembly factor BamB family protein n=1 Tax=Noviherbaspirillum denitrificans TaxID=1968433 RepID=UPI0014836993
KRGGGPTWLTGTYDPELDLVYWGVGNAGPWNAAFRKGDNLYIGSVIAVRPKTGEIAWHYQFSPNDPFDYDGTNELVIADMDVDGAKRKVIMQANRNGFFYVLDRTSGKLLKANPFVDKITWAKGIDMKTGRPIDTEDTKKIRASLTMDKAIDVWPSALGGKNWSPMSYDPSRRLIYANTLNIGFPYKTVDPEYNKGAFYLGMEFTSLSWPENGNRGYLKAIDPLSGKTRWQVPSAIPNFAGVLTTAGGLLFTGAMTGEFLAYDSETGKKLWQFQTGSGIVSMPITWERNGKQYVTVTSGIGGVYTLFSGDDRLKNIPAGGSVWTFALMDK